ncbi:MAG: hypothetical protein OEM79_02200 [Nitrosopumilus sp.]|nr:hypothetical protein [Nitrosopumilus sp.]
MPHDDFFEATLIEFTQLIEGKEKIIVKYDRFEDLPSHLMNQFKTNSDSKILLQGKKWKVLEINKDLRSHGKGMHVKVRLEVDH